jgi:hypothetical protein
VKSSQDDDEKSIIKLHENFREKLRNFSATWTGTLRSPFGPIDFPSDSFLSLYFIFFAVDVSGMPEFGLFFSSRGERGKPFPLRIANEEIAFRFKCAGEQDSIIGL